MIHQPMDIMMAMFNIIVAFASFVLASFRKKTNVKGFPSQLFVLMGIFWLVMATSRISSGLDLPQHESVLTTGLNLLTIGLGFGMLFAGWKSLRQSPAPASMEPTE
jgi:protein-S-isoprenylcysteine O-methyltransferase Ste14